MSSAEFESWPKIPRQGKDNLVITEKLDGTNAQINIVPADALDGYTTAMQDTLRSYILHTFYEDGIDYHMFAGSRKRYITPEEDNYGFAEWVKFYAKELESLGHGRHFGEWYGNGIQRGYGLEEKRLALFNTQRWGNHNPNTPKCCEVVPVIYNGELLADTIDNTMYELDMYGSYQVKGYDNPEGIIIFSRALKQYTKLTFEHVNGKWKGE